MLTVDESGMIDEERFYLGVSVRAEKTSTSPQLATLHQNQIIETIPFYNEDGFASSFATAGIDGNIFHWDLLKCGFKLAEVKDSEE